MAATAGRHLSTLSWLDYSDHERRKVLDLIAAFSERDTRDELGLGTIRDAFADAFFPGTSTVMTRARYFLFIPWIYLELERKKISSAEFANKARPMEIGLIDPLVRSDPEGAIGRLAGRNLKRLPSDIYWQGLGVWGIRLFPGSQDQYHQWLDVFYERQTDASRTDDGDPVEGGLVSNWHSGLPAPPAEFPDSVSFALSSDEASYLRERIAVRCSRTLLAFLATETSGWEPIDFPWEHPDFGRFPPQVRVNLDHARNFSEVMWGSALLYNLLLAEVLPDEEGISIYRARLEEWAEIVGQRKAMLTTWNTSEFWRISSTLGAEVSPLTRLFVDAWTKLALEHRSVAVAEDKMARRIIFERERTVKGNRARLENRRYLELWGGAAGTAQLSYRWPVTQRIVRDILQGLHAENQPS